MLKKIQFALMICLFAMSSNAQDAEETAAAVGPCKQDVATLCPGITPGKGAIRECLKANEEKLSAECKEKIAKKKEEIKNKIKDIHEVCKAEVEKFCSDITKGKGRIVKCLKDKKDEEGFGAECKAEIEELGKKKKKK
jgi:hypothetical protein